MIGGTGGQYLLISENYLFMFFTLAKSMRINNTGFTLVELIVVIAVIGIISTIGISSFTNYLKIARDTVRKGHLLEIKKYLDTYYALYGKYPRAGTCAYESNCYVYSTGGDLWIPELASITTKLPKDPINNANGPWATGNYTYAYGNVSETNSNYDLTGQLENTSDPDTCQFRNYKWYFSNWSWCTAYGGSYSNFLIEVGPPNVFR